jgi:hypothetical protein
LILILIYFKILKYIYFNFFFLLLINKNIFKILLTGLSTELDRQYILESWKIITANTTIIDTVTHKTILSVYSKELKKYYC